MKYVCGRGFALCLALAQLTGVHASKRPGAEPTEPLPPSEPTEMAPPPADAPKPALDVRIAVVAEGMDRLPSNSRVELQGEGPGACKSLKRDQMIQADGVLFRDLAVCKVKLRLFITGFDTKAVLLDLANYKGRLKITVKEEGPPTVTW